MRRYETIFIVDTDISDEERAPLFEKITELIPQQNGLLVEFDEWGTKKLAYEIKKKVRGFYVRLDYCGTGALVDEIERLFKIDERVLKYMTVLLEKNIDLDEIKEEIASKEAEKLQAAKAEEPEATQEATEAVESEAKQEATEAVEPEAVAEGENQTKSEQEES